MIKTLYLNIEDDVQTIVKKIARLEAVDVVLVFPRRSYLFADAINLRLLKKQTDMLGKVVSILTMDEAGQLYAQEAGFALKKLEKTQTSRVSDIRPSEKPKTANTQNSRVIPKTSRVPAEESYVRHAKPLASQVKAPAPEEKPVTHDAKPLASQARVVSSQVGTTEVLHANPLRTQKMGASQPHVVINEIKYPEVKKEVEAKKLYKSSRTKKKRSAWKIMLGFLLPIMLISALIAVFVLPQAHIIVYTKQESVIRDLEINAGVGIEDVDSTKMLLPAEKITKTLSLQDTFQSTGKKDVGNKSVGKVRIINLTGKPINLKATTTVLSLGGKNYQFTQDQNSVKVIQPNQIQTGSYTPTIADIIASTGGEDFNIPEGTRLEITNQIFGNQPQLLYAKTETPVIGGSSRYVSVVSEEDFKRAQQNMIEKMVEQIKNDLASQKIQLANKSYISEVIEFISDKPAGTESPVFGASLKATIKGLTVNQDQLMSIVESRIVKSMPENQKLLRSLDASMEIEGRGFSWDTGLVTLATHIEAKSSSEFSLNGLETQLLGKSREEASRFFLDKPEVEKVDIILSPYWQKNMPKFATKIKIETAN